MDKNLSDKFNLPVKLDDKPEGAVVIPKTVDETSADFQYARENLYSINELSMEAITELKDLASSSQQARAYEVLATLIGRTIEINKAFLELRKQKKDLEEGPAPSTVNQNLVLTTSDLNKLLASKNSQKDSE